MQGPINGIQCVQDAVNHFTSGIYLAEKAFIPKSKVAAYLGAIPLRFAQEMK